MQTRERRISRLWLKQRLIQLRQIHGCISSAVPTEREGHGSAGHVDPIRVDGTAGAGVTIPIDMGVGR
jgi:hypothetical protein